MKFEEFKNLVQERKDLKKLISKYDYMFMKTGDMQAIVKAEDYREELKPIELKLNENATEKLEGSFDERYALDIRLAKCLTLPREKVVKAIQDHFENDKLIFFYSPEEGKSRLVMFEEEFIVSGRNELCLDALADITESYGGFKKVLERYPELEEVLWKVVEEQMKVPKAEKESTLIQRMTEKQKELDFLQDPKAVKERIAELTESKLQDKTELEEVWKNYNEIRY